MVSKTLIGSSVTLWVLPRPGIKEWQRSKIHRRGPHPLEPGLDCVSVQGLPVVLPSRLVYRKRADTVLFNRSCLLCAGTYRLPAALVLDRQEGQTVDTLKITDVPCHES